MSSPFTLNITGSPSRSPQISSADLDFAQAIEVAAAEACGRLDMNAERKWMEPFVREEDSTVENLEARVDRLQEVVCLLLAKNQAMRLALSAKGAELQEAPRS